LPGLHDESELQFTARLYVIPRIGDFAKKYKVLKKSHKLFTTGKKLSELSQLREVTTELNIKCQEKDESTKIGDVMITGRTSTIRIGKNEIMLPPVQAELFKALVCNEGKVVPRVQLLHPFRDKEFPSKYLSVHIYELRRRLGMYRARIQTVKSEGYMYTTFRESDLSQLM